MKLLLFILVILLSVHLMRSLAWAAENSAGRIVRISTICLLDDEPHQNVDYVLEMVEEAAQRQQNDLIVVPLTPFLSFQEGKEAEDLARFADMARAHKTYLAVAMMEAAKDGKSFCTSVLLGRDGEIAGKYRKTHALPDDTMDLGDDLPVFLTDFGVLGLSLSTDFYFPEVYDVERMKGADILIWHHYPERFREHFQWLPLLKARSLDSHAHMGQ